MEERSRGGVAPLQVVKPNELLYALQPYIKAVTKFMDPLARHIGYKTSTLFLLTLCPWDFLRPLNMICKIVHILASAH